MGQRVPRTRVVGRLPRVQPLNDIIQALTRQFGRRDITYSQSAYIMKMVRRNLGLAPDSKPNRLPEIISWHEAERVIAQAYRASPVQGLIVKFLWMTMVRVSELVALEIRDVRCDEGYAKVRGGKGGKDRLIAIPTALAQEIKSYIGNRRRGPLFISQWRKPFSTRRIEQIVRQARVAARLNRRVTPHTLRRSMATELLNRGVREEVVSTLLGHASTETTRAAYARLSIKTLSAEVEEALRSPSANQQAR